MYLLKTSAEEVEFQLKGANIGSLRQRAIGMRLSLA